MNPLLKQLTVPFLTVLFALLTFFALTKLFGPIPFSVNSKQDFFTVTGVGEAQAVPDTATFSVGVTKTATTAEEAKNEINEVTNKIIQDFKALGIPEKEIKTTNFSVNPAYDTIMPLPAVSSTKRAAQTAYTATQTIDVKTKTVELANQAIDAASTAGANLTNNISFILNDKAKEQAESEARAEAIAKAKKKATTIADAAGITLGKLVNVQEAGEPQPVFLEARAQAADLKTTQKPTDLQPGQNTVQISVTLSYETR